MINLIPIKEKKELIKNFYLRFLVVFFYMLIFSIIILFIVILPSYFISVAKISDAILKLEAQKKEPIPEVDQNTLALIKDVNTKLNLVENAETNKFEISQKVIKEIILNKMSDIKIDEFSFQNDQIKGKTISINGIAPSRERLLLFRQALEEDKTFSSVDLPISNFIKGSNIQFYLNLIPVSK